jgi:hypothetical protein
MAARPDLAAMNRARATHAMSRTSTYAVWRSMLSRCTNPNAKDYPRYGGRGITVCDRWRVFENFLADMGPRPDGLTLERENGARGYEPGNCKWATPTAQARNRSSNVLVTHGGHTATVAEWAERTGLERKTLEYRLRAGWPAERALSTPSTINRKPTKCST